MCCNQVVRHLLIYEPFGHTMKLHHALQVLVKVQWLSCLLCASDPSPCLGGFKLWECALDLAQYLYGDQPASKPHTASEGSASHPGPHSLHGKRVMELGCGHGLPGILAMLLGAEVHFQVWLRMGNA